MEGIQSPSGGTLYTISCQRIPIQPADGENKRKQPPTELHTYVKLAVLSSGRRPEGKGSCLEQLFPAKPKNPPSTQARRSTTLHPTPKTNRKRRKPGKTDWR
jgi:hypothetical protein